MEINYGLDVEKQTEEQEKLEKHLMGAVSNYPELITEKPYWLPTWNELKAETQFGAQVETMGCTGYGTANILEMIWLKQFGLKFNLSDRAINKMSGTGPNGNTVDAPIDTIRKQGFLFEEEWPWDRNKFTWNDYYAPIPADKLKLASTRLKDWGFEHEYVPNNPEAIKQALKTSPIGGTVAAWFKGDDGIYRTYGHRLNHYTVTILDYVEGQYWICGDSYPEDYNMADNPQQPEFIKKLAWDYNFGCLKRYKIIDKRTEKSNSLLFNIKKMFTNLVAYMDDKGLHVWYIDKIGRQEIPLTTTFEKAIAMSYVKQKIIKTTSFPAIAGLPVHKFF